MSEPSTDALWQELLRGETAFIAARMRFLAERSDRKTILRQALRDPVQRGTALRLMPYLSVEERQGLFEVLIALASIGHADIVLVREAILGLPRTWVLARIDATAEPLLIVGGDEEFRRLLELYSLLDSELTQRLALRAAMHSDVEVREAGEDFLLTREAKPIEPQLVVLIIVTGGRSPDQPILAIWQDGFVVWSGDSLRGGPPYRAGWQSPSVSAEALAEVIRLADVGTVSGRQHSFGPGARWVSIEVFENGQPVLRLGSWHDLFEANPDLVATESGIEPLNGRDRQAVLAAQSADYRAFRQRWYGIKQRLLDLVPPHGVPYDANVHRPLPWS